jgi:hypothetical protein
MDFCDKGAMNLRPFANVLFFGMAFAFASLCAPAMSAPRDDLASPDQATRDAAAKVLRDTYVAPPRTKWDAFMAQIKPGMKHSALNELLAPYHFKLEDTLPTAGASTARLDDAWVLEVDFSNFATSPDADTLIQSSLTQHFRNAGVAAPKDFTGTWTNYFVNGQKSSEIHFRNGVYFGEFICYHDNGTHAFVQHYDETGGNGDDTGYFPSGKVMYRAHYTHGTPDRIWTWYREDGTISNTQDHTK